MRRSDRNLGVTFLPAAIMNQNEDDKVEGGQVIPSIHFTSLFLSLVSLDPENIPVLLETTQIQLQLAAAGPKVVAALCDKCYPLQLLI